MGLGLGFADGDAHVAPAGPRRALGKRVLRQDLGGDLEGGGVRLRMHQLLGGEVGAG